MIISMTLLIHTSHNAYQWWPITTVNMQLIIEQQWKKLINAVSDVSITFSHETARSSATFLCMCILLGIHQWHDPCHTRKHLC